VTSIRSRKLVARPLIRLLRLAPSSPAAILAAALLAAALPGAPARAAEDEQAADDPARVIPYVEYLVGASIVPNQTLSGNGATGAGLFGSARPDSPGYFFGGAVGAKFLEYFRSELQVGYRSTEIQNISVQGEPAGSNGNLGLLSIMANGYFEMEIAEGLSPFVGFGIGWGMPSLDADNKPGPLQLSVDDTDSVFVFNAMVGGTWAISDITDLSLGYRYIQTEDITYSSTIGTTAQRLDFEYDAHEIYLGLRFNF
jgi:opacity protein-like surface antigen